MNAERKELVDLAMKMVDSVCSNTGAPPAKQADLAVMLHEMTREVVRLNHVIDGIVALYTTVDAPSADYLSETGDR